MKLRHVLICWIMIFFHGQSLAADKNLGTLSTNQVLVNNTFNVPGAFADNYTFSVSDVYLNSFINSLTYKPFIGIENFTATLYRGAVVDIGASTKVADAVLTIVPSTLSFNQNLTIGPSRLDQGIYTLQISGNAIGSIFSSYAGNLSISPVPEPALFLMLLVGCLIVLRVRLGLFKDAS